MLKIESKLQKALNLKYPPIALLWSDEKPKNAMQFKEGKWGFRDVFIQQRAKKAMYL
jgi:hypothetical protein